MRRNLAFFMIATAALLARSAGTAQATSIDDLVRIRGMERNPLIGMGIVVGLDGTGDSSKASAAALRPFGELMKSLANPVGDIRELAEADAYAIVAVTMTVGEAGGHVGDRFDVRVNKLFNAESLEGGYLLPCLLRLPGRDDPEATIYAQATGVLVGEPDDPASAAIPGGAELIADLRNQPVVNDRGYLWLSIDAPYATWATAATIAETINDPDGFGPHEQVGSIARAVDAKTVRVRVPEPDRGDPANFIAWLTSLQIDPSLLDLPARVVIDRKRGVIVVTGNVAIDPVAISHRNLVISTLEVGAVEGPTWMDLDTGDAGARRSARLGDLVSALERMRVPVEDRISIIEELHRAGALHAEIVQR